MFLLLFTIPLLLACADALDVAFDIFESLETDETEQFDTNKEKL